MKRSISLVLAILMVASLMTFGAMGVSAKPDSLIAAGSSGWTWMDSTTAETTWPEGWQTGQNIGEWHTNGVTPIANGSFAEQFCPTATHVIAGAVKVAAVKEFTVEDADAITQLILNVRYDEDPKVYINGTLVFEAIQWHDGSFKTEDLTSKISLLKDGTNYLAIEISQSSGGFGFDLELSADIKLKNQLTPAQAYVYNIVSFGDINSPDNILDDDVTSCVGSGDANDATWIVALEENTAVEEIYLQCKGKEDGAPSNHEGNEDYPAGTLFGLYDVYVNETLVAEDVPALSRLDGGYTVKLGTPVVGSYVKVVVSEWYGSKWVNLADISVGGTKAETPEIAYEGMQMGADGSIRLIASGSDTTYTNVGFKIIRNFKSELSQTTTKAFKELMSGDKVVASTTQSNIEGIDFIDAGYLFGCEIAGIPAGTYTIGVIPTATLANGTVICGEVANVTFTIEAPAEG